MRDGSVRRAGWARVAFAATPLLVLLGSFVSACSDDENPFRRGFAGDSCTRTDDCADPLRCRDNVCTVPPSTVTNPDIFGPGPGPSASEGPWSACDECLEQKCGAAEKNCGPDCRAIQGCIETTCIGLSAAGSMDEGACQIQCQSKFPGGKDQHLAVVNCAVDPNTMCSPPCTFFPQDYDLCRNFMNNGDCFGYNKACEADLNCRNFRDCVSFCATLPDCLACDDTAEKAQGRALFEAYETCVAAECLTESWIP